MYLLDTNVWLELLLNQSRAAEVSQLLKVLNSSELALSDFSLHSICVILGRTQRLTLLDQFVADLFVQSQTALVVLSGAEVQKVTTAMTPGCNQGEGCVRANIPAQVVGPASFQSAVPAPISCRVRSRDRCRARP